jgi:hypothetical protein
MQHLQQETKAVHSSYKAREHDHMSLLYLLRLIEQTFSTFQVEQMYQSSQKEECVALSLYSSVVTLGRQEL